MCKALHAFNKVLIAQFVKEALVISISLSLCGTHFVHKFTQERAVIIHGSYVQSAISREALFPNAWMTDEFKCYITVCSAMKLTSQDTPEEEVNQLIS